MLGGISPIQLIIVLVIVILIFGTKKLRNMGKDIGGAVKGFKQGMNDKDDGGDGADTDPNLLQKRDNADADFSETRDKDESERKD